MPRRYVEGRLQDNRNGAELFRTRLSDLTATGLGPQTRPEQIPVSLWQQFGKNSALV